MDRRFRKNAGYAALHIYVRRHKPKPDLCKNCGLIPPYEVANITGIYDRDFKNYRWWCRKCHMTDDNRLMKLHNNNIGRFIDMFNRSCFKCGTNNPYLGRNGRPVWRKINNDYVCGNCYQKIWEKNRNNLL